jgi:hypothetical protein
MKIFTIIGMVVIISAYLVASAISDDKVVMPKMFGNEQPYISVKQFEADVNTLFDWTTNKWDQSGTKYDKTDPDLHEYFSELLFFYYKDRNVKVMGTPKFQR